MPLPDHCLFIFLFLFASQHLLSNLARIHLVMTYLAGIYLLKVKNRNTRTKCVICSKLTMKTPERRLRLQISIFPRLLLFWKNVFDHCKQGHEKDFNFYFFVFKQSWRNWEESLQPRVKIGSGNSWHFVYLKQ